MSFFKNIDLSESESGLGEKAVTISSETDLPEADENGVIQLEDNKVYFFQDFIFSENKLSLGENTPLIGLHGGASGFVHIGGQTALTSNGNPVLMRDLYLHSPGGILFDLDGIDTSTEFLVESCSFSDAVGQGNMASLGEIANFRVPTFKGCNFEQFNSGLSFTGVSEKIFFASSPFRNVTAQNVKIITLVSDYSTNIVDIVDCYLKGFQEDTEFLHVEQGGLPVNIIQYRGTTADDSVNKDNILTGEAGVDKVGTKVVGSYPLRDSKAIASLQHLDSATPHIVTDSGNTLKRVNIDSELLFSERVSQPTSGVIQYDGRFDLVQEITASVEVQTTTDSFQMQIWAKNEGEVAEIVGEEIQDATALDFTETNLIFDLNNTNITLDRNDYVDVADIASDIQDQLDTDNNTDVSVASENSSLVITALEEYIDIIIENVTSGDLSDIGLQVQTKSDFERVESSRTNKGTKRSNEAPRTLILNLTDQLTQGKQWAVYIENVAGSSDLEVTQFSLTT